MLLTGFDEKNQKDWATQYAFPAGTRRDSNGIITLKRRRDVVLT